MARKARNGKYVEYEKKILEFLDREHSFLRKNDNHVFRSYVSVSFVSKRLNIPKSSTHDILRNLSEPNFIKITGNRNNEISLTRKGKYYLDILTRT